MRKRSVFAASVAIIYLTTWWLVEGEASPLHGFFLYHVEFGNVLTYLSFPAIIVGVAMSHNVHQPNEFGTFVAMFVQWFVIGWLGSLLIFRRPPRQRDGAS